ncbi:hypothetical protein [Tenacibaculum jejuense]|uniref:Uncharacterized protein n=1 Tax=Tenacibaculum jejuense TaxID=584609 RepID=A0A238U5E0_9FLAO|nr:hypothetical protein [Tenacibaculum jejuense]SNR14423.1 protein of unknown function [Tenacibaculum jejuense]
MVSLKTLKEYDFNRITDYYEYILLSIVNGQRKQAERLTKKLSTTQKIDAFEYLENYPNKAALECKTLILNSI